MWRINLGIPTYNKKWVLEEDRDKEKTIKIHGKKRENRLRKGLKIELSQLDTKTH